MNARNRIKADAPMNTISTTDTIGGNSGSPMINAAGEIVGILFDGNRVAHARSFIYDDTHIRSVSVCSTAIIESLKSVYATECLLEELGR
jgi:V8-like Glu-specific endopeptidase